jgi:hypothetical protein
LQLEAILSELSGGNCSLIALFLILALLLFKLIRLMLSLISVVDKNIGRMIKCNFPHFQSIDVSLKEGNASVIFPKKFVCNCLP